MISLEAIADLFSKGRDLVQFVPEEQRFDPTLAAIVAVPVGLMLACWGARLLRVVFVLAFMAAGAGVGVRFAAQVPIDALFGLVVGGGIAGLVGHLFYRWWVGVTTGFLAVLLVAILGGQQLADQCQAFQDQRLGVATDEYRLPPATTMATTIPESWWAGLSEVVTQFWNDRQEFAIRSVAVSGLAWFFGLIFGLVFPRFTTVLMTSLVGVLVAAVGVGLLLSLHVPSLWQHIVSHSQWALAAVGLGLMGSLLLQLSDFHRPSPTASSAAPVK